MITVKLPDGSTAQFPDGTPSEAMKAAIQKRFPPKAQAAAPAAPAQPQTYDQSVPAQGLSGVNEGIANALGAPVDLANLALRGGAAAVHALGGPDIELPVDTIGGSASIKTAMGGAIKPPTQDGMGQALRRVGQEVGATLVPGLGQVSRSATPIREAASTLGTALATGGGAAAAQQVAPDNPYVELAGQILGGASAATAAKTLQKIVSPFSIDAKRAAFNDLMKREGIGLTAGQATGSKGLQYAESELGGGAASQAMTKQAEQFTRAALSRAGVSADRATPEVMDQAFTDLGNTFNSVAARNNIIPDRKLGSDLSAAVSKYNGVVSPSNRAPVIGNTIKDIIGFARTGNMTGEQYADLRSRLNEIGRKTAQSDHNLSDAAFGIQHALDDAMERSLARSNPNDLGVLKQARQDYKNLLVIEDAVGRGGPEAANGLITPGNLRGAVQRQGKRAYVRGRGDLAPLARAGAATMSPLPQSGTAPRQAVRNLGTAVPTILGAAAGAPGGYLGAMLGAMAGAATPYAAGRVLLSAPARRYLTNQVATGPLGLRQGMASSTLGALANDLEEAKRRGRVVVKSVVPIAGPQ